MAPSEADLRVSGRVPLYGVLVLMLLAVGGFFLWARQQQLNGARDATGAKAAFIASSILHSHLTPGDLDKPVGGRREHQLDQLFHQQILLAGNVRATLIGPGGLITYSTDHRLIGQLFTRADSGSSGTLDVRVPLVLSGRGRVGRFELSVAMGQLAAAAQAEALRSTAFLALILIGLYLSFLPVLAFVTNRIRRRLRDMKGRVRQMEHQAFHDTLTGLPNRALFRDRVEQSIRSAKRLGGTVAVMVMDLDRFKEVNDTFGHQSGDQLLKEVGAHIERPLRESDTVARLGGDEFAILAPTVAGPVGALAIAERAIQDLSQPHTVNGIEVDVGASIGVALYPHHGDNVDALLRCADIALYVSKTTGAPALYALEHDYHSADRLALGAQLRRAITDREITVYYQPETNFATGNIDKVEALVRWEHAERGLLSPGEFLPVAEDTGLIRPLTSYVLDVVLEQWRNWYEQGLEVVVAVNITGRDLFDQRFAYEVKDLLRKWKVRPSQLELEITEQAVLIDPVRAHSILRSLSQFGVRLAIDDFGTGNSSLAQLKRLPVEVLKIDKSFVLNMLADDDDATIVRSTIELAHNLGLQVVAEGIESAAMWMRLRDLGCDIGQGYYLSGPLPAERLTALLERLPRDMSTSTGRPLLLAAVPVSRVPEDPEDEPEARPVRAVS
ncbi:MAG TPA: EAL domain-containing protein [Solirubrobacteraceae bacterium]|nr:EAL domain-containing protein [Solirubrobacteraceae bacterium]